ncbi:MAG TPA: DUF5666 domain-containing protein [Rhodopila sp.]|nr:DUF5666 domain-containing protein [Rhodopila sp.]
MRLKRRTLFMTLAGLTALDAIPALAQALSRVRGSIESVGPDSLKVRTRAGDTVTLKLAEDLKITEIAPIDVSAIKPGAFIGTAAVTQPDGTLKAREVQVFPESMRGLGEGHRPWDLGANSTMTNGTVGDLKVSNGRHLTLTYKGGEQKVFVPPGVPVITYEPGSRALLKPGAHVIIFANHAADNSLTATRIGVGKDGLVPPM